MSTMGTTGHRGAMGAGARGTGGGDRDARITWVSRSTDDRAHRGDSHGVRDGAGAGVRGAAHVAWWSYLDARGGKGDELMTPSDLEPEIVHGFMSVVLRCLKTTVGVDAVVAAAGSTKETAPTIAVVVDLKGDVRGPVTWVFPPEIALELVRRLMKDPNPAPEWADDGAAELANILTGRATEVLESHGFRCELGPPRMHLGELPPGVKVHIATPTGPIQLVFSASRGA